MGRQFLRTPACAKPQPCDPAMRNQSLRAQESYRMLIAVLSVMGKKKKFKIKNPKKKKKNPGHDPDFLQGVKGYRLRFIQNGTLFDNTKERTHDVPSNPGGAGGHRAWGKCPPQKVPSCTMPLVKPSHHGPRS